MDAVLKRAGHRVQAKLPLHVFQFGVPFLSIIRTRCIRVLIAAEVEEQQLRRPLVFVQKMQGRQSVCVLVVAVDPVLPGVNTQGRLRLV